MSPKKNGGRRHNTIINNTINEISNNIPIKFAATNQMIEHIKNLTKQISRPVKNVIIRMMPNLKESEFKKRNSKKKIGHKMFLSPMIKSPSNQPNRRRSNVQHEQSKKYIRLINNRKSSTLSMIETKNMAYIQPIGSISNIYEKQLYDCYCFIIHCPTHERMCAMKSPSSPFIWLPCMIATQSLMKNCWIKSAKDNVAWILANESNNRFENLKNYSFFDQIELIEILRLQLPQTNRFITRLTYYVRLIDIDHFEHLKTLDLTKCFCCEKTDRLEWFDCNQISDGSVENLWGPELVTFCPSNNDSINTQIEEFSSNQVFDFKDFQSSGSKQKINNDKESWFNSIKITENDIERLYYEFIEHCYPSRYMTSDSFRQFLLKLEIELTDLIIDRLFIAFNYMKNGFITFHELLFGLMALEQDTPHDEFRIKFVFRYYDSKQHGILYEDDVKKMIRDLHLVTNGDRKLRGEPLDQKTKEIMELFQAQPIGKSVGNRSNKMAISWRKFLTIIATHQFRGTSLLCRSKKSIFDHIIKRITNESTNQSSSQQHQQQKSLLLQTVVHRKYQKETCQSCRSKQFKLSSIRMIINQHGYYDRSESVIVQTENQTDDLQRIDNYSLKLLQSEYPANFFMRKIREFNQKKNPLADGFMINERERLYQMFQIMAIELEPMLQKEQRIKQLCSPCYVIGDIHGNLEDLMSLEKTIWKQFPATGVHYLFLGDYVDRGRWSIECALYLFSMKLLMPKSITLLRGNHEIREIQKKYTYRRELWHKYDQFYGEQIWDLSNHLFDRMPLGATIDETIFCAHGGIPHQSIRLIDIEKRIPSILMSPESECTVAWEIMWSDPINQEHFIAIQNLYRYNDNIRTGYVPNTKRGTAFYFNEKALDNFLAENRLTHLIRAHEVPKLGFMMHFGHKCMTIFSSSHYCGNDNECCVLFVNQEKIRVIRIDTSANQAATDQFQQQTMIR